MDLFSSLNIEEKMKEMAQDLRQHNYNYYVLSAPTLPDSEFDKRMRELAELEKQ